MGPRVLSRAGRIVAWTAAVVLCAAVAAGVVAWLRPGLVVNARTASWALGRFGADWRPGWSSLDAGARSLAWNEKELFVAADDLCGAERRPDISFCIGRLVLRARVRLGRRGLDDARLDVLEARGGWVRADLRAPRPPARAHASAPAPLPLWVRRIAVGRVAVDLPNNRVRVPAGELSGALRAAMAAAGPRELRLGGDLRWKPKEGDPWTGRIAATGDAWDPRARFLTLRGHVDGGRAGRVDLAGDARPDARGRWEARLDADASAGTRALRVHALGGPQRDAWSATLTASLSDTAGPLKSAELRDCRLRVDARTRRGDLGCAYELSGDLGAQAAPRRASGRIDASGVLSRRNALDGRARLTLQPETTGYSVSGALDLAAAGPIDRGWRAMRLSQTLRLDAAVPRFQDVVAYLRASPFSVPAPLNTLDGPVRLAARSSGRVFDERQALEVSADADLRDRAQRADVRVEATLAALQAWSAARRFEASGTVSLQDVSLQLPYLELQAPPKVAVDPRIHSSGELAAEELRSAPGPVAPPTPFAIRLRVVTPGLPVRLQSNLVPRPIPVKLDVQLARPGGVDGVVRVEPVEVELFRRKAYVERLEFRFKDGSNAAELDGLIRYPTPEATVRIRLLGTTEKPRVQLESDPPMDRSQILALLLFGKAPSELDSDQAASVGHTNAALTEQAFGLASLWMFASTPIDYVGYNPETRTYSVRFRLPGGATAELGAVPEEQSRLRVRKRLTRHWALETEVRRDQTTYRNAVTTFLEWFRRY